jgi:hypothetical protein
MRNNLTRLIVWLRVKKTLCISELGRYKKNGPHPCGCDPSLGRKRQSHGRERINLSLTVIMVWGTKAAQQEKPPAKAKKQAFRTELRNA